MKSIGKRRLSREGGASLTEYSLLITLVAVLAIPAIQITGLGVADSFEQANSVDVGDSESASVPSLPGGTPGVNTGFGSTGACVQGGGTCTTTSGAGSTVAI